MPRLLFNKFRAFLRYCVLAVPSCPGSSVPAAGTHNEISLDVREYQCYRRVVVSFRLRGRGFNEYDNWHLGNDWKERVNQRSFSGVAISSRQPTTYRSEANLAWDSRRRGEG